MNISPPCAASKCEMALPPLFLTISSMTDLPLSRKLMRHDDGLLLTSTGVIRCIAVQFCISLALQPLGVHHFSVTVSYSDPSSNILKVFTSAVSCGLPEITRNAFVFGSNSLINRKSFNCLVTLLINSLFPNLLANQFIIGEINDKMYDSTD